ncbi:MAG: hypothetical protein QF807_03340 [Candidatus Thalassarchaeaceae archaeon]|nr:hypothetical protein [Candidatus Thalassarchaeaceae archaeon]MDP7043031.1 hypothetical protein [Candidatus Thalassarchaeaceae archaeon]
MRARLALVLALLCFSTSMLSGCIGLVASRELMEWNRGVPDTDQVTIPYSFEHTFDSTNPEDIIHNPEPKQISVDLEVKEMRVFFRVQMPYSEIGGIDTANVTSTVRYVHAKLWEPDANKNTDTPFWEENTTTDHYPPMKRFYPPFDEGVWELEVRAQGYGWTSPVDQLSFHDEFEVSVSVVRPCILFPELEGNDECIPV